MIGTIFKRRSLSGRLAWGYSIDIGRDATGKRLRPQKVGFALKSEAEAALRRRLNEMDAGEAVKPDPSTFAAYMTEWLREFAEPKCTPKTVERYRQLAAYVTPLVGHVRLQELTPFMLRRAFNKLKASGGWDRKAKKPRSLSAKTVRHIAGLVHSAFEIAIEDGLLKSNPVIVKHLPKPPEREAVALDTTQLAWFADAARAAGLYEFLMVAAGSGLRRGELLAMRWTDTDLASRALWISRSLEQTRAGLRTKSTKSGKPRLVPLPPSTVEILKAVRAEQERRKQMFGSDYRSDLDLVFCAADGDYLKPDSVTAKVCLIAKKAGMKNVGIHCLRHTYGSQLLSAGVPLATVSRILGHSKVSTTANIYIHSLAKDEATAADKWEAAVHDVIERERQNVKIS